MKNHIKVNGQILQTNKKFSQLKRAQQQKILEWLVVATNEANNSAVPQRKRKYFILAVVEKQIELASIHLPFGELERYYMRKKSVIDRKCAVGKPEEH